MDKREEGKDEGNGEEWSGEVDGMCIEKEDETEKRAGRSREERHGNVKKEKTNVEELDQSGEVDE